MIKYKSEYSKYRQLLIGCIFCKKRFDFLLNIVTYGIEAIINGVLYSDFL
jgi:hypothetical protein